MVVASAEMALGPHAWLRSLDKWLDKQDNQNTEQHSSSQQYSTADELLSSVSDL